MENNQYIKNKIYSNREFMKSAFADEGYATDQQKQLAQPPLAKASISNDTIKLNLSCGAIGCGTCAIAAFNQEEADSMLGLDGEDEFVIYAAPVGVI